MGRATRVLAIRGNVNLCEQTDSSRLPLVPGASMGGLPGRRGALRFTSFPGSPSGVV